MATATTNTTLSGKRARRHPIKRTTSMTEFSYDDLSAIHPPQPSLSSDQTRDGAVAQDHPYSTQNLHKVMGFVSPRGIHRRNSADFALQSTNNTFLRTCCLCNRRLALGRDVFMYRGDSAFCSLECRHKQMTQDEKKEKCTPKEYNSSSSHPTPVSSTKAEKIGVL